MHIEGALLAATKYTTAIATDNFIIKFFSGIGVMFINDIYNANEALIQLIILIYLIDFITGVTKAIKHKVFSSKAFFRGATKLIVYGIFMMIALAVDKSIGLNIMLPLVFTFITTTDAASILENLEELGYDIPKPLIKLLQVHKNKFFYNKVREMYGDETFVDVEADFKQFRNVFIPLIKGPEKKLFEIKINTLEGFAHEVIEIPINDCKTFGLDLNILLNAVGIELKDKIAKTGEDEKVKKMFLERHFKRVDEVLVEINTILLLKEGEKPNKELRMQKKNNIIQAILRIITKGISDNIKYTNNLK